MSTLRPIGFLLLAFLVWGLWIPTSDARSSGGRSGGGSFSPRRPSRSGGSSSSQPSAPNRSRSNNESSGSPSTNIYAPSYGGGYQSIASADLALIALLLVGGGSVVLLFMGIAHLTKGRSAGSHTAGLPREAQNETVTVSKIQVALYAQAARSVQSDLLRVSQEADWESREGLKQFLAEVVLVLLRQTDSWSHALGSSEKLQRDQASALFDQLSFSERSKFSEETFSALQGRVKERTDFTPDGDVSAYIVVTILVGTEHDKPLFGSIDTREKLHNALTTLGQISPDFLLTVEVLWSPQVQGDSLTEDEMLAEYTTLLPL